MALKNIKANETPAPPAKKPAIIGTFEGKCADANVESWRPVSGYEGYYEVSNHGKVKGVDRYITYRNGALHFVPGKELSRCDTSEGYLVVVLSKNGKCKNFMVHRLVATAFLDNPDDLYAVNHKDGDKHNNHVDNLEWCTLEYNNIHAMTNGLAPATHLVAINQKTGYVLECLSAKQFECLTNSSNASYCLQHDRICNGFRLFHQDAELNELRDSRKSKIQPIGGNKPVPVVCEETGQTFPSIAKCGKFFNIDDELIRRAVRHGTGYVKKLNRTFKELDRRDSNAQQQVR